MGEMRKLSVEVDAATADMIEAVVADQRFKNEAEVLRYALLLFGDWVREGDEVYDRAVKTHGIGRLREMIAEGFASGNPVEATDAFFEDIKTRGMARRAGRRAAE